MDSELKGVTTKMRSFEERFEERVKRIVKEEVARSQEVRTQIDESLKQVFESKGNETQWSHIVSKQVDDKFIRIV